MKFDLSERLIGELRRCAESAGVEKVILFGSRARLENTPRSDVDLAVNGGDFNAFYWAVKETTHSLLTFDIVDLGEGVSEMLKNEIQRDGVRIYEKNK